MKKAKYYERVRTDIDPSGFREVEGIIESFRAEVLDTTVTVGIRKADSYWTITEVESGLYVDAGYTRKEAIEIARENRNYIAAKMKTFEVQKAIRDLEKFKNSLLFTQMGVSDKNIEG